MKFLLLRHGNTLEGSRGIILGSLPGTLSQSGREEIVLASSYISHLSPLPTGIISSDLTRAYESAIILSKNLRIPLSLCNLIRERGAGVAEGLSESEIDWSTYEQEPLEHRRHAGGESFLDVKTRATLFLSSIDTSRDTTLILVSHHVFLAMLAATVLDWSIQSALAYDFSNCLLSLDTNKKQLSRIASW
jgi:probable phosphoglycerate mutase